jgi:hypothetical protein
MRCDSIVRGVRSRCLPRAEPVGEVGRHEKHRILVEMSLRKQSHGSSTRRQKGHTGIREVGCDDGMCLELTKSCSTADFVINGVNIRLSTR